LVLGCAQRVSLNQFRILKTKLDSTIKPFNIAYIFIASVFWFRLYGKS
jgi:hypothetical protein